MNPLHVRKTRPEGREEGAAGGGSEEENVHAAKEGGVGGLREGGREGGRGELNM